MTTRSARWPVATCATLGMSVNTSVATGCPDSASQVAAPTNLSADSVGTTVTSAPGGAQPADQLAGLVGGDAAADAEHHPCAR